MHGQSFDIMKLAAKTLLNTLGEDDYVNVAQFARNVSWVTPCMDTLVQVGAFHLFLPYVFLYFKRRESILQSQEQECF